MLTPVAWLTRQSDADLIMGGAIAALSGAVVWLWLQRVMLHATADYLSAQIQQRDRQILGMKADPNLNDAWRKNFRGTLALHSADLDHAAQRQLRQPPAAFLRHQQLAAAGQHPRGAKGRFLKTNDTGDVT